MLSVRRVLCPLVAVWLSCQVAAVALTPLAFWASAAADAARCTCPLGAERACPMHQKPVSGSKVCVMQGASDQATVLLSSLIAVVGLMPKSTPLIDHSLSSRFVTIDYQMTAEYSVPPDPPPPRA
jgi:hypothetical protein